jgi:hypothetical protein
LEQAPLIRTSAAGGRSQNERFGWRVQSAFSGQLLNQDGEHAFDFYSLLASLS